MHNSREQEATFLGLFKYILFRDQATHKKIAQQELKKRETERGGRREGGRDTRDKSRKEPEQNITSTIM